MDLGLGLDDFLKNLKDKTVSNPPLQSQASKRKQKRIMNSNLSYMAVSSQKQESTVQKSESGLSLEEISIQSMSQPIKNPENKIFRLPSIGEIPRSEKGKDTMIEEEMMIFQNKAFVFIPYGIVFTKKQVEILSENIRKHGGKTFEVSFFDWKPLSFIDLFVITSKQMPYNTLLQTISTNFHNQLKQFVFLDFEWIVKCLQDNVLIVFEPYSIQWNKVSKQENEAPAKVRDIYATRHVFRNAGPAQAVNRRLKRNIKDTEALDQYLEEEKLELEALALESKLLFGPTKKVRMNKHVIGGFNYLFDFSFKDQTLQLPGNEIEEEDKLNTSRTEIMSCEDENDPEFDDFSGDILPGILIEEEDSKGFEGIVKSEFKREDSAVLIDDDVEIKDESSFSDFPFKNKERDVHFISTNVTTIDEDENSFLHGLGLEFKGNNEKVNIFKAYNPLNKPRAKYWDNKKEFFVCQTGTKQNHNPNVTQELEKLQKVYTNEKDFGRMCAYRKAVAVVRALPFKIEKADDLKHVKELGQKIKEKIVEIVTTGRLKKADIMTSDIKQKTIEILTKVWGIGPQTAIDFFHKGFRTIDDLRRNQHLLNDNQKVGLKYYDDLLKRMPREEVAEILKIVADKIEELADEKRVFEVICCGSYRRGKTTCGDIDILVTRKDGKPISNFLNKLVKSLEGRLLTDHLMMPKQSSHGNETYMGICRNGGLYRRIDIKIYPREQFGYALVHFTGNDFFNRSMRLFARRKGMTLSDHGLHPSIRKKQDKLWTGQNIPCYTEEEVFKALGLQYRPPTEREV